MKNKLFLPKIYLLCFLICYAISSFPQTVSAEDDRQIVRVGVYNLSGFCEQDALGNLTGYNIDYLNKIAGITGWDYEFVETGSFSNGLIKLETKQIDLLAPCQITPERQVKYDFSSYSCGTEYTALITNSANDAYNYQDFESFNGINVGVAANYLITDYFIEYAKKNNFEVNLKNYSTPEKAIAALREGEVDAAAANLMSVGSHDKVLARFSPSPYYYMTWNGNDSLLEQLDNALLDLNSNYPSLENDLQNKYFPIYKERFFSKEELSYADSLGTIRLGYIDDLVPISFTDPTTGELDGITRYVFDRIGEYSGLDFSYIPLTPSMLSEEYLRKNQIHLISGITQNSVNLNTKGMKLSNPYLEMQDFVITKDDFNIDIRKDSALTLALSPSNQSMKYVIQYTHPNLTVLDLDNEEACFDAVKSGKADLLIQNQYTANLTMSKPKYESLAVLSGENLPDSQCFGILTYDNDAPPFDVNGLNTILNKAITQISAEDINSVISSESLDHKYRYTIADFFYKYYIVLIPLAILIGTALLLLIYTAWLRNRNLNIARAEEAKLQSIANNISGGVMVLLPDSHFQISYVNEGLLTILGYNKCSEKDMIGSKFISYIQNDDAPKLTTLSGMNEYTQNKISMQLRMKKADSSYIETIFAATLTHSMLGTLELYCVIMDLTEQIAIKEKLVYQQRRHELLLEKSDDIIYEIDIAAAKITSSEKMQKKFGWYLDHSLTATNADAIASLWHIHAEDKHILSDFIRDILHIKTPSECTLRMNSHNGTYLWCKIKSYPLLSRSGEVTSIIGLIADIDQEMLEKLVLEKNSRTDGSTGLMNKKTFLDETARYLNTNDPTSSAIIFIDLDHFKSINDTLGHLTGDRAILDAAGKIRALFAENSFISRFGGDEFCIFLKDVSRSGLSEILSSTVKRLAETYEESGAFVRISGSIGAVYNVSGGKDLHQILDQADQALYVSKENGRNGYTLWDI